MPRYESDRLCYPLRAGVPGRRRIIGPTLIGAALTALVALGGCAGGGSSIQDSSDTVVCLSALVAAGVAGGQSNISGVALSTPACIGLAGEIIQDLIAQASVSAASARQTLGARG